MISMAVNRMSRKRLIMKLRLSKKVTENWINQHTKINEEITLFTDRMCKMEDSLHVHVRRSESKISRKCDKSAD